MQPTRMAKWILFSVLFLLWSCAQNRFSNLVIAEEKMVQDCRHLDTISEQSDPGNLIFPYKYGKFYDGELKVLERADHLGATHVVWVYNYPIGSSASVYRCDP
jgi:hypothetical protein